MVGVAGAAEVRLVFAALVRLGCEAWWVRGVREDREVGVVGGAAGRGGPPV